MGAILFFCGIVAEYLPEFQLIRAGLSLSPSLWAWVNQMACFWWEQPSWKLTLITLSLGFVRSRSGKVMLLSPVL